MQTARLFIVTYKGFDRLNKTLESLFDSDTSPFDLQIYVINNHTDIRIQEEFGDRVTVLHNTLRPDWSNGHLSRNWNQALLHGFENLEEPACDIVITVQDDTIFKPEWAYRLSELHDDYTFVQNGLGDQFVSYKAEAVKSIGLWDERFIFSYHVADYFRRAKLYNGNNSTINDPGHGRVFNPIFENDHKMSSGYLVKSDPREVSEAWEQSSASHNIGAELMRKKYGDSNANLIEQIPPGYPKVDNFLIYPYFETDINDLEGKHYLWQDEWNEGLQATETGLLESIRAIYNRYGVIGAIYRVIQKIRNES